MPNLILNPRLCWTGSLSWSHVKEKEVIEMAEDSKDPFSSDTQRDLVGSSKLTLGALIAIVLGGTAVLFACLAFLWISLARRRRAMRRDAALDINCGGSRSSRKGNDGQSPKPQRGSIISMVSV